MKARDLKTRLRSRRGQFIPISAMVMLTLVLFMVAVVNIYKVSRAKLKVQNLADAVALNLASQQAQHINAITDRNEWLNHLYPNDDGTGKNGLLPGISHVEYNPSRGGKYVFNSETGAKAYARLVNTINEAQDLFSKTYNTFLGAEGTNKTSLSSILRADIPDLNEPDTHVIVWNTPTRGQEAERMVNNMRDHPDKSHAGQINSMMEPLRFKAHDIVVRYKENKLTLGGVKVVQKETTFSKLAGQSKPVGWMELPDANSGPYLEFQMASGQKEHRIGVGAYVVKTVQVLGKTVSLSAKSMAYVVKDSGKIPMINQQSVGSQAVEFKPTFWVKLATK